MIIKNHSNISSKQSNGNTLKYIGLIAIIIVLFFILYYLILSLLGSKGNLQDTSTSTTTLIADAETVEGSRFVLNEYKTDGAAAQSNEFAYEGQYSIKLQKDQHSYGFGIELDNITVGDSIFVKVWVNAPSQETGSIAISGEKMEELYAQGNSLNKTGWQLLEVAALVSKPLQNNKIKIYCFNFNENPIYFDNLYYGKKSNTNLQEVVQWIPDNIHLFVQQEEFAKLKQKRLEAMSQGTLVTTDDSWVDGYIYANNKKEENTKVSLRLKGDWTDHLQGEQWSFRVQTPPDKAWNRLKTFSLQVPKTRSYLYEWMLHQLFKHEDVLTTRYEFINMKLNNNDLGLYVYEEHFLKQIPEYNKRKEGPILKFEESGFWESYLQTQKSGGVPPPGGYEGSPDIKPFAEGKVAKSDLLSEQYVIAQNLLYQYQYGLKTANEIFDLDILAKYYAITDLTGSYHGVVWHNQRFYYNPVSGKLEPIGFDGFEGHGIEHAPAEPFLGSYLCTITNKKKWHRKLFMDKQFVGKYLYYLEQFSQKNYIQHFIDSIQDQLGQRKAYIQQFEPDYTFDPTYLFQRGNNILNTLYPNSQSLLTKTVQPGLIAVCNRHHVPLNIIGTASQEDGTVFPLDSSQVAFSIPLQQLPNYSQHIPVPQQAKYLVYTVLGLDKKYYCQISSWPVPEAFSPAQELTPNLQQNHAAYLYIEDEKRVVFRKNAIVNQPIVIPQDHIVIVEAGSKIDIQKGAFVLSYSYVRFLGTEEEPILVNSSDKTAKSFTVIKTKKRSKIEHTTFANMGAFSYKGWNLPGAVNFYEAAVDIRYSTFTKNTCEDAINIVRTDFVFDHNTVSHTFADGFDADFCIGMVSNCYFYKTGNDCIDFSTSTITIKNSKMEYAGDKGISIGEAGTAHVINTTIDHAVIGVASKDLSKVVLDGIHLNNCSVGFAVYEKKPEYGGAFMYVNQYTSQNTPVLHKVYPNSYLKLLDKEIKGD